MRLFQNNAKNRTPPPRLNNLYFFTSSSSSSSNQPRDILYANGCGKQSALPVPIALKEERDKGAS